MLGDGIIFQIFPGIFLRSNKLEKLEFKLGKIIGILKHAGRVRKSFLKRLKRRKPIVKYTKFKLKKRFIFITHGSGPQGPNVGQVRSSWTSTLKKNQVNLA